MINPLRVGVIGLGPRWQRRYKPALRALRDCFRLVALCDQVQQRAALEAGRLGCDAALGPTELLTRDDLDAALLLDAQWYRLWPLELACRLGKPAFCCTPLELDEAHADAIVQEARARQVPVLMEQAPRWAPATNRLREVLETGLGPARLLLCDFVQPSREAATLGPGPEPSAAGLLGARGSALVDWCLALLGGEPRTVLASDTGRATDGNADPVGLANVLLECGDGRAVSLTRRRAPRGRRTPYVQVITERGTARADLPNRVSWTDADGRHRDTLAGQRPLGQVLLEQFHRCVRDGQNPGPNLDDAYRVLGWLRTAARSHREGRRLELSVSPLAPGERRNE
jgi:predicted dehydrogenase